MKSLNQGHLLYIKSIIKNYFRVLFLVSIVSKIIFPNTVQSYIASFLKTTGISKIIYENLSIKLTAVYFVIYLIVQISETSILYFSFTKEVIFIKIMILTLTFFIALSMIAYKLNIPGDCGCFGDVLEFSNDIYKFIFNLSNLMIAFIYTIIQQKLKMFDCIKSS